MKWKIATFNVNGVRSREHVLTSWLESRGPDVVCLQEIKCQDSEFPVEALRQIGYEASVCGQKSFNGVAILSKRKPEQVRRGFGDAGRRTEARLIAAKIDGIFGSSIPMCHRGKSRNTRPSGIKLVFFYKAQKPFPGVNFKPSDPLIWTWGYRYVGAGGNRRFLAGDAWMGKARVSFLWKEEALADVASWGFS